MRNCLFQNTTDQCFKAAFHVSVPKSPQKLHKEARFYDFFSIGSTLVAAAVCGLYYGSGTKKKKWKDRIKSLRLPLCTFLRFITGDRHITCAVKSCHALGGGRQDFPWAWSWSSQKFARLLSLKNAASINLFLFCTRHSLL